MVFFQSARDKRHFVTFVKSKSETLIQEYQADPFTDMFQVSNFPRRTAEYSIECAQYQLCRGLRKPGVRIN